MTPKRILAGAGISSLLVVLAAGAAFSAQDRYGLSVPASPPGQEKGCIAPLRLGRGG
jgi:hypothetical protein